MEKPKEPIESTQHDNERTEKTGVTMPPSPEPPKDSGGSEEKNTSHE